MAHKGKLQETLINRRALDFVRSLDMENETALLDARDALKAVVTFLQVSPVGEAYAAGPMASLLDLVLDRLETIKIGVHLSDL